MKKFLTSLVTVIMILLAGTALYMCENYTVYNLVYIFCFIFIAFYAICIPSAIPSKIAQVILYALIMAAQIVFNVLVIRTMKGDASYDLSRLCGVFITAVPFIIRANIFCQTEKDQIETLEDIGLESDANEEKRT